MKDDLISRQAAIDAVIEWYGCEPSDMDYFKEILAKQPSAQPEQRWIPCSEVLPKDEKYYLVQNEYWDMMIARYTHSEYWEQIYQLKPVKDEIIAWMPLPEPYKAEREDTE